MLQIICIYLCNIMNSIHENKYSLLRKGRRDLNVKRKMERAQFDIRGRWFSSLVEVQRFGGYGLTCLLRMKNSLLILKRMLCLLIFQISERWKLIKYNVHKTRSQCAVIIDLHSGYFQEHNYAYWYDLIN
jgi:hypothetical protein